MSNVSWKLLFWFLRTAVKS